MPSPEARTFDQVALLWYVTGYDTFGQYTVESVPREVNVRWVQGAFEEKDSKGNTVSFDAYVVLGRDVEVGSQMWLGTLADWYQTGSAGLDDDVMVVSRRKVTPDIRGRDTVYRLDLVKFRDSPSVA